MKTYRWLTVFAVLALALGSVGMGQAEILPPYGEGQIGLQAVVLCETLTLRQQPSSSAKAVKTLHYGDQIIVQPETGGWAACFLSDSEGSGRSGWVNEDYLAIDPAWYRTEGTTPVYAWNDTDAPKVALLDKNTTLPILRNDGNWLIVSLRGATGWIYQPNSAAPASPASWTKVVTASGRQDGERFETSIMLEGMAETVWYEHIVNTALGIEMDYDYDMLERRSTPDCERFVSRYDYSEAPTDYLEVRRSAEDAETVAAEVIQALSQEFDIARRTFNLDRAGACIEITADALKGQNMMPDLLQTVYIIPAANGCIVAEEHCAIESAEGFGHRIAYMMNTLALLNGR